MEKFNYKQAVSVLVIVMVITKTIVVNYFLGILLIVM